MKNLQPNDDPVQVRRDRLRQWIEVHFNGEQVRFIADCATRDRHINQGELSGLLNKKSFGEKKARSLEDAAQMPFRYLDTKPGYEAGSVNVVRRELKDAQNSPSIHNFTACSVSLPKSQRARSRWVVFSSVILSLVESVGDGLTRAVTPLWCTAVRLIGSGTHWARHERFR